jgi:hypothetical protein
LIPPKEIKQKEGYTLYTTEKEMKESVAIAKEADAKKDFSSTRSDKSVHRVRDEPERQLGSLRSVINTIRSDGGTPSVDSIATELSGMHSVQRAPVLLALQRTHGNRYVQRVVAEIQAKLKVGQPGDIYEQEADRMADAVMRMPEPEVKRRAEGEEELAQTKPLAGQITPLVQRQVEEEGEVKENKKFYGEKEAPIFALPLKYRLFIDPKTMVFVDTPYFYTKTEMEGFYRDAKESKNTYVRIVEKLEKKYEDLERLDPYELDKREGGEIVARAFSEVMQVCVDPKGMAAAWTRVDNPYSDIFCKIEIPKPKNPFLVFPFWQHERVHLKDCLTLVEKAKHEYRHITPTRVAARDEFYRATIWVKSEIDAYRVTVEEIQRELETYEKKSFEPTSGAPMSVEETYSIHRKQKGEKEKEIIQTKEITPNLESHIRSLKGGGQPLPESVRAFFEPRFGYDFGQVRIHADARAADTARMVNAQAFTLGRDVVFGARHYALGTAEGKRLLAHELVHVVQQNQDRLPKSDSGAIRAQRNDKQLFIMREEGDEKTAAPKPKINYKSAKRSNTYYAGKNILGWESKLVEVAGGAYKGWADLWKEGKYDEFADAVAAHQVKLGCSGKDVDGVLGLKTWAQIAGLGEAMAGIRRVRWEDSEYVCTQATKERIMRGHKIATGKSLTLPEDKTMNIFNAILQSVPSRMLDVELKYRGTGAAGALAYARLGEFVPEADIWAGKLKPGAAVQVWGNKDAYDLLREGEIEEGGKKRRITDADANFYGTSFVFVRYDTESFERMLVRHYGSTEWKSRGSYAVWVAANAKSAEEAKK